MTPDRATLLMFGITLGIIAVLSVAKEWTSILACISRVIASISGALSFL